MKYLDLESTINLLQDFLDELKENDLVSMLAGIPRVIRKNYIQERIKDMLERTELK